MKYLTYLLLILLTFGFSESIQAEEQPIKVQEKDGSTEMFPASQLPLEEPTDKFTSELLNMVITLGMIVGVIFALAWILKRMLNAKVQQDNANSLIKVIERRTLSPKAGIYVLEVYGKTIVIGESPNGFQFLTTIDETEEPPEPREPTDFEKVYDRKKSETP